MKLRLTIPPIILLSLTMLSITASGQNSTNNIQFSIHFTACFLKDLISLKLNDTILLDKIVLTTDKRYGITALNVYQDRNNLWINSKRKIRKISAGDTLHINIQLNGQQKYFSLNLKNGKYILIDKCPNEINNRQQNLNVEQLEKPPLFD